MSTYLYKGIFFDSLGESVTPQVQQQPRAESPRAQDGSPGSPGDEICAAEGDQKPTHGSSALE
jgi:hypothetical protein